MILTMNKTRIVYAALTFEPRPQVYKNTINVCQYFNIVTMRHYSLDISVNQRSKDDMRHTIFQIISMTW